VVCTWTATNPVDYTVLCTDGLESGTVWGNLPGYVDMPGQDGTMSASNAVNTIKKRFYCIEAVNSPLR